MSDGYGTEDGEEPGDLDLDLDLDVDEEEDGGYGASGQGGYDDPEGDDG